MSYKGYNSNEDGVPRSGEFVDNMLTKIKDLSNVTYSADGTMSKEDKYILDNAVPNQALSIQEIDELLNF